jgi:hypothetical protein
MQRARCTTRFTENGVPKESILEGDTSDGDKARQCCCGSGVCSLHNAKENHGRNKSGTTPERIRAFQLTLTLSVNVSPSPVGTSLAGA